VGSTRDENAPNKLGSPEFQTCLGMFEVAPLEAVSLWIGPPDQLVDWPDPSRPRDLRISLN
jgi:hypothetical protein